MLLIYNTNRIHAGELVYGTLWKLPALCHVGNAEPAEVAPPLYPTTWMRAHAGDLHHEFVVFLENQYHNFGKVQVHFFSIILTVFLLVTVPRI